MLCVHIVSSFRFVNINCHWLPDHGQILLELGLVFALCLLLLPSSFMYLPQLELVLQLIPLTGSWTYSEKTKEKDSRQIHPSIFHWTGHSYYQHRAFVLKPWLIYSQVLYVGPCRTSFIRNWGSIWDGICNL